MDRDAMVAHLVLNGWRAHGFWRQKKRGSMMRCDGFVATRVLDDGSIQAACFPEFEASGPRDEQPRVIAHFSEKHWRKSGGWPGCEWNGVSDIAVDRIFTAIAAYEAHRVLQGKGRKP